MSVKRELKKIAEIVGKQQQILTRLAQQVIDTSRSAPSNPLDKLVRDATIAWVTKTGVSANSSFDASGDGSSYNVDVKLTITDPRKTSFGKDFPVKAKESFLRMLQDTLNKTDSFIQTPVTFNVTVVLA